MMFKVEVLNSGEKLAELFMQAPNRKDANDRINELNLRTINYNEIEFLLTNEMEL